MISKIENTLVYLTQYSKLTKFSENEIKKMINEEVENLLRMNVLRAVQHIKGEFISTIFTVP